MGVVSRTRPERPVMRYHGGKYRIAPWIVSHLPEHRIYVEAYGGAASVLLHKERTPGEVYNDLDGDVVNVFRVLRDPSAAEALRRSAHLTPYSRDEFELSWEPSDDPVERARRTVARSFFAHGTSHLRRGRTGFRARAFRRNGTGASDWATWPEAVPAFVDRLRGVIIENRVALEVIDRNDSEHTLHYLDPPYPHSTRSSIRCGGDTERAYKHELSDDDHRELAEMARSVRGMVVISGYHCDLYEELYGDWDRVERAVVADHGAKRVEVLWRNEAAASCGRLW